MRLAQTVSRALLLTSALCLAGGASAAIYEPQLRKLQLSDVFLLGQAKQVKHCIAAKTCRLSLVDYATPSPYLAFIVERAVWEKLKEPDVELYKRGAGHILLRLHKRPASALKDKKYGGAGLPETAPGFGEFTENVREGLRSVRFFVYNGVFEEETTVFTSLPRERLVAVPEMDFIWGSPGADGLKSSNSTPVDNPSKD